MFELENEKVVYKDLSYLVVGVLFDVYNEIGGNHYEKNIQKAIARGFDLLNIKYQREVAAPLFYKGKQVGKYYLDFVVEDKLVLEIKRGYKFAQKDFSQVEAYLKAKNYKLGILVLFTKEKVKFKRILNIY
jgi:GxxExxY protein